MHLHSMKLLKIICNNTVVEPIVAIFHEMKLHSYTVYDVHSEYGDHRLGFGEEQSKAEIELITSEHNAGVILQRVHDDFMAHHSIIAYTIDIKVMGREKFL